MVSCPGECYIQLELNDEASPNNTYAIPLVSNINHDEGF